MRLNDAGLENGKPEVIVSSQSKINISGLVFRSSEAGWICDMQHADTDIFWRFVFILV